MHFKGGLITTLETASVQRLVCSLRGLASVELDLGKNTSDLGPLLPLRMVSPNLKGLKLTFGRRLLFDMLVKKKSAWL